MKKSVTLFVTVLILLFSSNVQFAGNKTVGNTSISFEQIETTLLAGLSSENIGLRISSAYMLGEIRSKSAVNKLTVLLRESDNEKVRLVAALSLLKIGTERSIFMVKQSRKFNSNNNVRNFCEHLYKCYLYQKFCEGKNKQVKLIAFLSE